MSEFFYLGCVSCLVRFLAVTLFTFFALPVVDLVCALVPGLPVAQCSHLCAFVISDCRLWFFLSSCRCNLPLISPTCFTIRVYYIDGSECVHGIELATTRTSGEQFVYLCKCDVKHVQCSCMDRRQERKGALHVTCTGRAQLRINCNEVWPEDYNELNEIDMRETRSSVTSTSDGQLSTAPYTTTIYAQPKHCCTQPKILPVLLIMASVLQVNVHLKLLCQRVEASGTSSPMQRQEE
jgi:hypothetical protein